jgi:hypothetical protein
MEFINIYESLGIVVSHHESSSTIYHIDAPASV